MRGDHEKAAGVLDTPATATESKRQQILNPQAINRKDFSSLQARFAIRGYALQRVFRAGDLRPSYHARRWGQTFVFGHPHDLSAFLAMVEGRPL